MAKMSLVALEKSLQEHLGRNVAVVMHGGREASAVWWERSPHRFFFPLTARERPFVFFKLHSIFGYEELVLK